MRGGDISVMLIFTAFSLTARCMQSIFRFTIADDADDVLAFMNNLSPSAQASDEPIYAITISLDVTLSRAYHSADDDIDFDRIGKLITSSLPEVPARRRLLLCETGRRYEIIRHHDQNIMQLHDNSHGV